MPPEDPNRLTTLLDQALAGDPVALNALLEKLRPYLLLLVRQRRRPGHENKLGDSDLVQETLMRIHRGLDAARPDDNARFHGEGVPQLLGWVGTIISHVVVDGLRHGRAGRPARDGPGTVAEASAKTVSLAWIHMEKTSQPDYSK